SAARIYEVIVKQFDAEDAFAWEYLGYNLARGHEDAITPELSTRILNAYQRAVQLKPHNPLYAGRLLGFEAQIGKDVSSAFDRLAARWANMPDELGYAVAPVFHGLTRAGRLDELENLASSWRTA